MNVKENLKQISIKQETNIDKSQETQIERGICECLYSINCIDFYFILHKSKQFFYELTFHLSFFFVFC